MANLSAWIQAARPPAYINLGLPLLLGQALAWYMAHPFSLTLCGLVMLYGGFMQLFIVFLNDYADGRADALNTDFTLFSGGSRVVPQGRLSARALYRAGIVAGALVLDTGLVLALIFDRPLALALFAVGLALLWAYSLPPFQLNYRGGGELLQGIGCGFVLPLAAYYVQAGRLDDFPWLLMLPHVVLYTLSAIATSLPDKRADRLGGKRTLVAVWGVRKAAWLIILLGAASLFYSIYLFPLERPLHWSLGFGLPVALLVFCLFLLPNLSLSRTRVVLFTGAVLGMIVSYTVGFGLALVGW